MTVVRSEYSSRPLGDMILSRRGMRHLLAAAVFLVGTAAIAQQPVTAGRTYTVKAGDSLWELSRTYLNDPFLWPEIYRLNASAIEDPHWIYPGQVLQMPGEVPIAQVDRTPQPSAAVSVTPNAPPVREPTFRAQATPQRVAGAPAGDQLPGTTVFSRRLTSSSVSAEVGSTIGVGPFKVVREGEFYAAPWLDRRGGPVQQGVLIGSAEIPGVGGSTAQFRLQPYTHVHITLPRGITVATGDKLLVASIGPLLERGGQVMRPTGVIQIEKVEGATISARIMAVYDEIKAGQLVMPIEAFTIPLDTRPAPTERGPITSVVYSPSLAVLPTIQRYVLLSASRADGVKMGDQYTLFRPAKTENGVTTPEEKIALVQVVRVTDHGASAMIVDQMEPAIRTGTPARLTARMP
ncbi:MAG: LysM peptidoglycan-binding domain-containing protein [Gemmatimonadota bacterium]|nr:LysM peptidoglycan-binding domain-containing protein [Gemmatimonadota bacterium]